MRQTDLSFYFAVALRQNRKSKGISQELLAEKADCDSTMVSLIERQIRNPTLNMSDSLAQGLGTSLSELIEQAEALRQANRGKRADLNKSTLTRRKKSQAPPG